MGMGKPLGVVAVAGVGLLSAGVVGGQEAPSEVGNPYEAAGAPEQGPPPGAEASGEVRGAVAQVFELADSDADERVSRGEAAAAAGFLVGAYFARADGDGDGVVDPGEARRGGSQTVAKHPSVGRLLRAFALVGPSSDTEVIARWMQAPMGKPLAAPQAQQGARRSIDELFVRVDTNKDGSVDRAEAERAADRLSARARPAGPLDVNEDGGVDATELEAMARAAARAAFTNADVDGDRRLSNDELRAARVLLLHRISAAPVKTQPAAAAPTPTEAPQPTPPPQPSPQKIPSP